MSQDEQSLVVNLGPDYRAKIRAYQFLHGGNYTSIIKDLIDGNITAAQIEDAYNKMQDVGKT